MLTDFVNSFYNSNGLHSYVLQALKKPFLYHPLM